MRIHTWHAATCLLLALALTAGCQKRETDEDVSEEPAAEPAPAEPTVAEVQLGHGVNSAHQVENPADTFSSGDTIWASVKTEDTPAGTTIVARWVYTEGGAEQVVAEDSHTTAQAGTGYTSFFVTHPDPWPEGSYELRVVTGGEVRETKEFSVGG